MKILSGFFSFQSKFSRAFADSNTCPFVKTISFLKHSDINLTPDYLACLQSSGGTPETAVWISSPLLANVSPLVGPTRSVTTTNNTSNTQLNSSSTTTATQVWAAPPMLFPTASQSPSEAAKHHDFHTDNNYNIHINNNIHNAPPSTPAVQFYPSSCHKSSESNDTSTEPPPRAPLLCNYHNFPIITNNNSSSNNNTSIPSLNNSTNAQSSNKTSTKTDHYRRQSSPTFMQQMQSLLNPDFVQPSLVPPSQSTSVSSSSSTQTNSSTGNTMLPPPPRLPSSNHNDSNPITYAIAPIQPSRPTNVDIQHLNWIRELNERARQMLDSNHSSSSNIFTSKTSNSIVVPSVLSQKPSNPTPYSLSIPQAPITHPMFGSATTTVISSSPPTLSSNSCTHLQPVVNTSIACDWHHHSETPTAAAATTTTIIAPTGAESEERRARRLERNRESARLSRRRKKETLLFLGKKVQRLQDALEELRASQIVKMETQLAAVEDNDNVYRMIERYKLHADVRKQVSVFQYHTMKETMLPQHHQFLLWISNHPAETFYTAAKDCRPKGSAKMSSKQIGEEIFTTERQQQNQQQSNKFLECKTDDVHRFWPLFCYEMSFSVEQEEKFKTRYMERQSKIKQQRRRKTSSTSEGDVSSVIRLASAFALVSKLSEKSSIHNHYNVVATRRERLMMHVLNETQRVAFLKWMKENKERCASISKPDNLAKTFSAPTALDQLCEELERTLNLNHHIDTPR